MDLEKQKQGKWENVRAFLILLHLMAIGIGSFPVLIDRRGLNREDWKDPVARNEFERWSGRLGEWGFEVTPEQVEERVWRFANRLVSSHEWMKSPFEWYYQELGARQRWRMFPVPLKNPTRLCLEVEEGGEWRRVYCMRAGVPESENWKGELFAQDRVRSALNLYSWGLYEAEGYQPFVRWVEVQLQSDFPKATRGRVRFEIFPVLEIHSPQAEAVRVPWDWEESRGLRLLEWERP